MVGGSRQSGFTVYLSGCQMRPQSFKWSTDCLVVVPSFRPSHAPRTTCGGYNPVLHRQALRKFRIALATRLEAGQ